MEGNVSRITDTATDTSSDDSDGLDNAPDTTRLSITPEPPESSSDDESLPAIVFQMHIRHNGSWVSGHILDNIDRNIPTFGEFKSVLTEHTAQKLKISPLCYEQYDFMFGV